MAPSSRPRPKRDALSLKPRRDRRGPPLVSDTPAAVPRLRGDARGREQFAVGGGEFKELEPLPLAPGVRCRFPGEALLEDGSLHPVALPRGEAEIAVPLADGKERRGGDEGEVWPIRELGGAQVAREGRR